MASRAELEIRASAIGVVAATYPNDSVLEKVVVVAEKAKTPDTAEVKASGTLTLSGNAVAGETVTIGGRVYTWIATAVDNAKPFGVLVGAAATNSLDNLKSAILCTPAGRGTVWSNGTTKHPTVNATTKTATTLLIVADRFGVKGNSIDTTETMTNGAFGATKLASGVNGTGPKLADLTAVSS